MASKRFPRFSPQDRLLAWFPWPASSLLLVLLLLGSASEILFPDVGRRLHLVSARLTSLQGATLWSGHFVQPDSLTFVMLAGLVLALFAVEIEARWGPARLLGIVVIICPLIGFGWVGIERGADKAGFISGTQIPLAGFPLITFLVAARLMTHPSDWLLGSGYRLRTLWLGLVWIAAVVAELCNQGTWTIVLPAHLWSCVLAIGFVAASRRRQERFLARVLSASALRYHPPDESSDPDHDRLDAILGKVAASGLDSLTWPEWSFLQRQSRQWRQQRGQR